MGLNDWLGKRAIAKSGVTGSVAHEGVVIGVCEEPTLIIQTACGNQVTWVASLCEEAPAAVDGSERINHTPIVPRGFTPAQAVAELRKSAPVEAVRHPSHYNSHPSGVECLTIVRHMNFNLGNAIKYIWRAGLKSDNAIQDLEKAAFYIQDEIERLKKETECQS